MFAPQARLQRPPPPRGVVAEELVPGPGGQFQLRAPERQTLAPPSGTFNFVRVEGEAPRSRPVLMSSRLPHAQIAAGRPVVYAGTARFERGAMVWWSNYSGTYQPMADFRAQAGLPEEKFVPWQRLQMGGVAMQRGTFGERRVAETPTAPARPDAVDAKAKGTAGGTGQGGKQGAGTGGRGDAKP
ncbi:MAG: hypothetical protein ACOYOH_19345 [Paracraurococcus sp.]